MLFLSKEVSRGNRSLEGVQSLQELYTEDVFLADARQLVVAYFSYTGDFRNSSPVCCYYYYRQQREKIHPP